MSNGKSWHDWYVEERSAGARVSDKITLFIGSWPFVYIHVVWFGFWVFYPVEPFPYGFLTMLVSLEAIILATLIMMSQNRQAERDRYRAEADLATDVAAKKEIDEIQEMLARIDREKLDKILAILKSSSSSTF
ncbi:DUF1003 domain-containing protein [Candidatus Kaiserbacteria bacterium]|nr:DUF1003 domain-containing protein [Candidatus Kaiserbacteria bacterium]